MKPNPNLLENKGIFPDINFLIEQLPTATALLDLEFSFISVSEKWLRLFNASHKDFQDRSIYQVFDSDYDELKRVCIEFLNDTEEIHYRVQTIKPRPSWLKLVFKPYYNPNKEHVGTLVHVEDITELVDIEIKNDKLHHLLDETSEISKVGMWEYDLVNNHLSWSKMTKRIHEVDDDFVPEVESAIEFYKEGHSRNKVSMDFQKALDEGEPFSATLQIITAKGQERWARNAGKPIYKNGKMVKIIGTFQDIDDQVRNEMKIRENERLLESIIDNLPLNVYVKDADSRKILVNRAECEYLGVRHKTELLGKSDFDIYNEEVANTSREEDVQVMRTLNPILGRETLSVKKDGTETTFLTSKIPLIDIQGKAIGIIGISLDISNLKEKEAELKDLINVTALQNKKLLNFAHIVSHNLRSHSANFSMLLNFLTKENDNDEKQRIVQMLVKASDSLMVTLEDLNTVIAINDKVNLDIEELCLNSKLQKVQQDLSTLIAKSNLTISNNIPANTRVCAVSAYLESVLLNLMTNAIKYRHPERNPIIELEIEESEHQIVLIFKDNGIGIDMNKNGDKLFGMYKTFHQNKDARGMGLYIIKNQMEAMGGSITAESTVGEGTTFKIYFNEK